MFAAINKYFMFALSVFIIVIFKREPCCLGYDASMVYSMGSNGKRKQDCQVV